MSERRRRLRATHRIAAGLAAFSAVALVLTVGVRPTYASWVSTTTLGRSVGTASSSCTTPGVYRTTATSRYLAGSVAGTPISSGALAPLTADNPASAVVLPSGAVPRGTDAGTTAVSAAAVAAAVPGLASATGTQTQYAGATSTGRSDAASGAVTGSGAVDATAIDAGTAPAAGTIDVSGLLAGVAGGSAAAGQLTRLRLTAGPAAATAALNECARRWGAPLSSALTRSATAPSLALRARAGAVKDLVDAAADRSAVSTVVASVTAGSSTSSAESAIGTAAGNDLASALRSALGLLASLVGSPSTTVSVTTDLSGVATAAQRSVDAPAGGLRLDGATGDLTADLAALGGTASAAPNTAVVSTATTSAIASRLSGASGALVDGVDTAWDAALAGTSISVDVAVPLLGLGTVTAHLEGTAARFAAGTETVTGPVVTLLPNTTLPVGLDLTAITSIAPALLTPSARGPVSTLVIGPLTSAVTAAKSALDGTLSTTRSLLAGQLAVLPTVLSVTVDEQPDVAPFPSPVPGLGSGYQVTALRLKVLGGSALDLAVASASVGPDRTVNE